MMQSIVTQPNRILKNWSILWLAVWRGLVMLSAIVLILARRWPVGIEPLASLEVPFAAYVPQVWIGSGATLAALAAYLLAGLPGLRRLVRSPYRLMVASSIGLAIWAWLSLAWAADSTLAILPAARLTLGVLLGLAMLAAPLNGRDLALAFAIGVTLQAVVALAQFFAQRDLGLQSFGELMLDVQSSGASVVADSTRDLRLLRAYGLSVHPNLLGGYLAAGLLFVAAGFTLAEGRVRYLWALVLLVGVAALLLSFSRGAWLAVGVGGLATGGCWLAAGHINSDRLRSWIAVSIACLLMGVASVWQMRPLLMQRLGLVAERDPVELRSSSDRAVYDELTLESVRARPLTGTGIANLVVDIDTRLADDWRELDAQPTHRVPLLVLAELGIVGLALWLLTLGGAIWAAHSLWPLDLTGGAAIGGIVALAVVGLFDHYPWTIPSGIILWWMMLAFAASQQVDAT